MPFGFGKGKNTDYEITPNTIDTFKIELVSLIQEILNPEIPFEEII